MDFRLIAQFLSSILMSYEAKRECQIKSGTLRAIRKEQIVTTLADIGFDSGSFLFLPTYPNMVRKPEGAARVIVDSSSFEGNALDRYSPRFESSSVLLVPAEVASLDVDLHVKALCGGSGNESSTTATSHCGHSVIIGWCLTILGIAFVLVMLGTASMKLVIVAIGCTVMMAIMMWGVENGNSSNSHVPPTDHVDAQSVFIPRR